jgi:hypothetical protein
MVSLVTLDATVGNVERTPAWPLAGLAAGALAGLALFTLTLRSTRKPRPKPRRKASLTRVTFANVILITAIVTGGWLVAQGYVDGRYVQAGIPLEALATPFHNVRNASVAVFGTNEVYQMFGPDLSNRVANVANRVATLTEARRTNSVELCRKMKQFLSGRYRYVAIGHLFLPEFRPPTPWFTTDPSAVELVRRDDSAVFRLDGALQPAKCPA